MPRIELTREELYERIWTTPARHLAKEFGVSDVALGKVCKKYQFPKPPPGYWARVKHGNAPKRPRLPRRKDTPKGSVVITASPQNSPASTPIHPEYAMPSRRPRAIEPFTVPSRLRSPLSIVARTREALEKGRQNDRGLVGAEVAAGIDVMGAPRSVPRAMLILSTILRKLDAQEFAEVDFDGRARIEVCGEPIELSLTEGATRTERPPTEHEKRWDSHFESTRNRKYYELVPNGRLCLQITNGA